MLIHDKKHFGLGLVMLIGFAGTLAFMFTPNFGGENAFHASDRMFNAISKGSTYYIPDVLEGVAEFDGERFEVTILQEEPEVVEPAAVVLSENGFVATADGDALAVSGDLGALMRAALDDADKMFHNNGEALSGRYGMDEKQAMLVWWKILKGTKFALDDQKVFAAATFLEEQVLRRGVEVGYNYYGIEGKSAADEWFLLSFALIFYVIYTLWFGYSIFFLFEGFGLRMTAGRKKET